MIALIVFLTMECLLFLLVFPIKINTKSRVSYEKLECIIAVKIYGLQLVLIKIKIEEYRIRIIVNGKILSKESRVNSKKKIMSFDKSILKLVDKISCIGLVGGGDAMSAGQNYALTVNAISTLSKNVNTTGILPVFQKNQFILDLDVILKITLLDVLEIIGEYGTERNIEANN